LYKYLQLHYCTKNEMEAAVMWSAEGACPKSYNPVQLIYYASVPTGRLSSFAFTMEGQAAGKDSKGRSKKGVMWLGLGHTGWPDRRPATFAAASVACVCVYVHRADHKNCKGGVEIKPLVTPSACVSLVYL